jgi:gluconokinase
MVPDMASSAPLQVVVMGVSATGKSTVAEGIAGALGWTFVEGDDLHPEANVAKMASGQPLTDEDRAPWLDRVNAAAREHAAAGLSCVLTCSALKRAYRDRLSDGVEAMFFVHLDAGYDVLEPRMAQRERHFMPTGLLRSQFDTLEPLAPDEDGEVVDVAGSRAEVLERALGAVRRRLG